jgi:hypothetical protein
VPQGSPPVPPCHSQELDFHAPLILLLLKLLEKNADQGCASHCSPWPCPAAQFHGTPPVPPPPWLKVHLVLCCPAVWPGTRT